MVENLEGEEWRVIPGYSAYKVSNMGRLQSCWKIVQKHGSQRSDEWKLIDGFVCPQGYRKFHASPDDGRKPYHMFVHRAVLLAFVGPAPYNHECRHLDGDKLNNRLDNLCWGTKTENTRDKKLHGTFHEGERHGMARLKADDVREIRRLKAEGLASSKELAARYGVHWGHVNLIVARKTWKHI